MKDKKVHEIVELLCEWADADVNRGFILHIHEGDDGGHALKCSTIEGMAMLSASMDQNERFRVMAECVAGVNKASE